MAQTENWVDKIRSREDYREFVGPADEYDLSAAMQFNILTFLGLREHHTLLDIGCGSLRGGRLFIIYLLPSHYFAIEPEKWLVENAIAKEIGKDLIELKSPTFAHKGDYDMSVFGRKFDYVLAQGVFTHAPEWQIRSCMLEVAKCMMPTTIFAASYFQSTKNYEAREWLYPETTAYTPSRIAAMAADAGLKCIPFDWHHPRGAKWVLLCPAENEAHVDSLARKASAWYHRSMLDQLRIKLSMRKSRAARRAAHIAKRPTKTQ